MPMEDEDMALFLLTLLPWSYANFITTLIHGPNTITRSDITVSLLSYDQREKKWHGYGAGSIEGMSMVVRCNQGGKKEKAKKIRRSKVLSL